MAVKQAPRLPFDSQPQQETITLGNERVGTLTFPVYGDLTVNESAWLTANKAEKSAFSYTSTTALKIANLERIEPIVAHNFVAKVLAVAMQAPGLELTEKESEWSVKYVRDLELCAINVLEVTTSQQNALVTCLIRHRLEGMHDWSLSDTAELPSELVEQISEFAQVEQSRGTYTNAEDQVEDLKELLGKSLTEATTKPQTTSTGQPSSTNAKGFTPETKNSAESASDSSPADTPSDA